MREAQLSYIDAANYQVARSGWTSDWTMFWVFDDAGGPPNRDEIISWFRERTDLLWTMRRRIADVPGLVDYPYWVADESDVTDHIDHQTPDLLSWDSCLERISAKLGTPLDARIQAWRATVFREVQEIPSLQGSGTVVVLQVSHALMVGSAMTSVSNALFGAAREPVVVEGLGPTAPSFNPIATTVRGATRMPGQMIRFAAGIGARRMGSRPAGPTPISKQAPVPTQFNRHPGRLRTIRTFHLDHGNWKVPDVTATATALTAISRALETYFDEHTEACPPNLSCLSTVAIRSGADVMGVNRVGAVAVDLQPNTRSLSDRAEAIQASLIAGKEFANSAENLNNIRLASTMPFTYFRSLLAWGRRHPPQFVPANTVLTSVKCDGPAEWSLCGSEFAFAGLLPALATNLGLAHSIVGVDDILTVSVLSSPAILPDIGRYSELLEQAFREVRETIPSRRSRANS